MLEQAATLVSALAAARKATQFYPPEHPRFVEAIGALVDAVRLCAREGTFPLNLHQGRLYAGSEVIGDEGPAATSIAEGMEARRIESLTFLGAFSEADARGLTEVLNLRPAPNLDVEEELLARGVSNVSVAFIVDQEAGEREERDREREQDRSMYRRLVSMMRSVSAKLQQGKEVDLADASDLVQEIMVRLLDNQAAVLGLATIRAQSEASLFHSINVMIYTLALAATLNLPEEGFQSLGVCALVHDIGKAAFDVEDPDQAEETRLLHPQAGADILSRIDAEDRAPMLVAYEHHMAPDGSGWPERAAEYVPHPYSRMVAIADRYESLTKSNGDSLTPDRAVAQLLHESGTVLDPLFTRLFVQTLGVFPVGCLVRLSDQSVGIVCAQGDDPLSPKVRVVYDDMGIEVEPPHDVDLAEDELTILEVVEEQQLNVAVSDHL